MNPDEVSMQNWQMHHQIKTESFKALDNIILIVSTGSFVISITFLGYFGTKVVYPLVVLLVLSWACLLGAIFASALSHYFNAVGSVKNQHLINVIRASAISPKDWQMNTDKNPEVMRYDKWSKTSRIVAVYTLAIGIIFLFLFAALTVGRLSANNQQVQAPDSNTKLPNAGYRPH